MKEKFSVEKTWKGIAIGELIICIITTFIYLFIDISIAGIILAGGLITSLLWYTIGEIVEQLVISNHNTYEIHKVLSRMAPPEEKKETKKTSYFSAPSAPVTKTLESGRWFCKDCGQKNEASDRICKGCGKYR